VAAVADASIVIVQGPNEGREFDISGAIVIGRDTSAGLVIDDPEASRRHSSLSIEGDQLQVEDLGSTNGTFVNGARISEPKTLAEGDKLRIGTTVFEVHVAAPAEEEVQATRVGTALPDLDDLQVTAPRQVPDFAKEEEPMAAAAEPEPPTPEPPAPEPVAPEPIQPTAAGIPQPPAPTNAPPPSSGPPGGIAGPPGGGAADGPPPPPGGAPPPPSAPPPAAAAPPPPSAPPPGFAPAGPPMGPPAAAPGGLLAASPGPLAGGELSGWWRRVGAALLDGIISIPFLVIGYVLIVSPILMKREGPKNGQTWGKQALGIRVIKDDGQPFTYGTALLRDFVIKTLLMGAIAIVSLINSLWPLWDPTNQALHDKLAGTHVFRA
jgi:pSer/pThr/pTyr-binding forkhead associated (FHA) protein/uncharacterized RDD family membrane protein YckC